MTAPDQSTKKTYTVNAYRASKSGAPPTIPSSSATLSAIALTSGTLCPAFQTLSTDYVAVVANSVGSITVTGTKSAASMTVSGQSGQSVSLREGINAITLTVTAEDGKTKTDYIVRVYRIGTRPTDLSSTTRSTITLKGVEPGAFTRGGDTIPKISVIKKSFRISEHEITRDEFEAVMGSGNDPTDPTYSTGGTDPVQKVSWYYAIAFCNKLSIADGLTQVYTVGKSGGGNVNFATLDYSTIPTTSNTYWDAATADWSANGYRLPTEMEWRWAAMGAQNAYKKAFAGSTGTNAIGDYAVFGYGSTESGRTTENKSAPVGSKSANELGLYDMTGNVHEWCWDWFKNWTDYTLESDTDAGRGASSGTYRVIIGGSWKSSMSGCILDSLSCDEPSGRYGTDGFRIVRN